eukprot:CAMPEP_0206542256 /NCGR_PEP_ID=MMETSP0325_2-20121206/10066_1 /ASSEMBLY_ACC=CAM_ASM_000347 /TAXON_ID=2866 /ORGANISM="Crypthecodinium cohnii, Strain Seligo" /LENGTH=322 /DNA_ID=CAMNT_0054040283 /DNA_START=1 /DNA_END=970 /DNA_ORIENTATION=+
MFPSPSENVGEQLPAGQFWLDAGSMAYTMPMEMYVMPDASMHQYPMQMEVPHMRQHRVHNLPVSHKASASSSTAHHQPASEVIPPPDAECERALERLNSQDASVVPATMDWVIEQAWPLANSATGCRVVQKALDLATREQGTQLAEQMKGRVREASTSPHANHVLQKCVELLPPERLQFILDEMLGDAVSTARHRFGCRVLERLIEKCPSSQTEPLLDEVLTGGPSSAATPSAILSSSMYLLTAPPSSATWWQTCCTRTSIQRLARHRVASHVVRAALVHCPDDDRMRLVEAMRSNAGELADLAHHHCGSFVVRQMRREMRR